MLEPPNLSEDFDFAAKAHLLFKDVEGFTAHEKLSDAVKDELLVSFFGLDQGYDKVACESASMPCVRYNLLGARSVVIADALQVIGYMQRKGVAGNINMARMASFFRSVGATTLADFQAQCTLEQATVGPGDLLYLPTGAVVSELARACNVGLRVPLVVDGKANPNARGTFARRREDIVAAMETAAEP